MTSFVITTSDDEKDIIVRELCSKLMSDGYNEKDIHKVIYNTLIDNRFPENVFKNYAFFNEVLDADILGIKLSEANNSLSFILIEIKYVGKDNLNPSVIKGIEQLQKYKQKLEMRISPLISKVSSFDVKLVLMINFYDANTLKVCADNGVIVYLYSEPIINIQQLEYIKDCKEAGG